MKPKRGGLKNPLDPSSRGRKHRSKSPIAHRWGHLFQGSPEKWQGKRSVGGARPERGDDSGSHATFGTRSAKRAHPLGRSDDGHTGPISEIAGQYFPRFLEDPGRGESRYLEALPFLAPAWPRVPRSVDSRGERGFGLLEAEAGREESRAQEESRRGRPSALPVAAGIPPCRGTKIEPAIR
ncbi:hypothetical protein KM043_010305 [Ampulex compressa]|nr:hypothetical protein KM043_010305 [Ampulex compressa]